MHYDISKIIIGLVIVGGIIKPNEAYKEIIVPSTFITIGLIIIGTILINKGSKDE